MNQEAEITQTMDDAQARFDVDGKITTNLFGFVWLSGFLFGLDFVITDGLLSMPAFLEEYFPNAYKNMTSKNSHNDPDSFLGCLLFGDFLLNLYRSCIYLAAFILACAFTVSHDNMYDKMRSGILLMFIGATISVSVGMLNIGLMTCSRIVFGMGVGVIILAVATHALEIDPCRYQRRVMTIFPLAISSGMFMASFFIFVFRITMEMDKVLPLSLSIVAVVVVFNVAFTRCASDDFNELLIDGGSRPRVPQNHVRTTGPASYDATRSLIQQEKISLISIFFERKYMPPLVLAICLSIFQQLTGVYAFMIYAPVLFRTTGLGEGASLLCSSVMYGVNFIVTRLSSTATDKLGRRSLFMQGGITMLLCQTIITFIILVHENLGVMPMWNAILLVVAMCAYVAGFAWSWGPLGWLVPNDILPLKIQSMGYSLCVIMNMLSMFFVTQFFATWLCDLRFGMHLVILSLVLLMTIFVYLLLPETKGAEEVDNVSEIWNTHWFWKKFMEEDKIVCVV